MRYFLLLLFVLLGLRAGESYRDGLFAEVVNVPKGDVLNVREKPDYRSKKVASIPYDAPISIGVEKCKRVGKSIWCEVYPLVIMDIDGFDEDKRGWVNAKFLKFSSRGYVLLDKKGNCYYSLGCKNGYCNVIVDAKWNDKGDIISLKTKKIKRARLHGESSYGATSDNARNHCILHLKLDSYLHSKSLPPKEVALKFLRATDRMDIDSIAKLLPQDPNEVIIVSDAFRFGILDRDFSRGNFIYALRKNAKVIKEYTERDDVDIWIGMRDFLKSIHKNPRKISKIERIKDRDLRGFPNPKGSLAGFIIRWKGKSHYEDLGMVVILRKYHGKWFVVGLAKDRWSI